MLRAFLLFLFSTVLLSISVPSETLAADCSSPDGNEAEIDYFSGEKVYKFCNGTEWITLKAISSGGGPTSFETVIITPSPISGSVPSNYAYNAHGTIEMGVADTMYIIVVDTTSLSSSDGYNGIMLFGGSSHSTAPDQITGIGKYYRYNTFVDGGNTNVPVLASTWELWIRADTGGFWIKGGNGWVDGKSPDTHPTGANQLTVTGTTNLYFGAARPGSYSFKSVLEY